MIVNAMHGITSSVGKFESSCDFVVVNGESCTEGDIFSSS